MPEFPLSLEEMKEKEKSNDYDNKNWEQKLNNVIRD